MKLILETVPAFFVEEDKILTVLFEEGLDILHLRKPDTQSAYSERLLALIPKKYHKRIVIYEHFYLKDDFGLMGIHLDQCNPLKPYGYSGQISCTCLSLEEVKNKKGGHDYVFLSSAGEGAPQEGEQGWYSAEQLRKAARERIIDGKVMAAGDGMCLDDIPQVRDFGFGGVVINTDLWSKFDIRKGEEYNTLIEHFKRLKKATD
jgi:thiamine-phosphate pyrophosphorylase